MRRTFFLACFVVVAIVVHGQEETAPPAAHQTRGQDSNAPQSNCSVIVSPAPTCAPAVGIEGNHAAQAQQNGAGDHPRSYLSRLFSPENLPQIGLIFVGIGGIFVAISTLRHLQDSSERQLRAYVMPHNAGLYDGSTLEPPQPARNGVPGVIMVIKNSGQTPAYKVVSWVGIDVIPVADEARLTVPPIQERFALTLGGGATFSKAVWFDRQLAANEITDILAGTRAIYVHGRIEYRDAFKKTRFANFRISYTANQFPAVKGAVLNFSARGNDAD